MQTDIEAALIGIGHLAQKLDLSRRTIHRILARGELPSIRIGGRRLIRIEAVRHWLAGCEVPRPGGNLPSIARRFSVR